VGRISIGRVVEKNGKRLPEKDDQFTLTTQIQNREGWVLHPLDDTLRKKNEGGKLRSIPVRMPFNDPGLNLRAEYSLFDRETGRPFCVGNGETCRRDGKDGVSALPCPSPGLCELGRTICKPYGRLNVIVGEGDDLGTFIFRTTSFNSIRTLAVRLTYFSAVSHGLLACLPLELKLRGKSTMQSYRSAIYYVDLVVPSELSLEDAIERAQQLDSRRKTAGFDQAGLDDATRRGFGSGAFEESNEDGAAVVEEFFPEGTADEGNTSVTNPLPANEASLSGKLKARAEKISG
ncbi:MAG: hydrolase or metal-binding protein, partial [Planctomycetota bacterium]|nr:hydrolase or metal-binding protein [Planctomycetota bacterium]